MFSLFCLLFSVFVCLYQNCISVWYEQYQTVVFTLPNCGTDATRLWYGQYHSLVLSAFL